MQLPRRRPSSTRRVLVLLGAGLSIACGSASPPASEAAAPAAAPTGDPAAQPVLVLGARLRAARFELLEDGTVRDDADVYGRLEVDGTFLRADGSVCARVTRGGAVVLEPRPSAPPSDVTLRIEGRDLVFVEDGAPHVVMSVDGDALVHDGERDPVPGLTPARHRAMLAAHALFFVVLLEGGR